MNTKIILKNFYNIISDKEIDDYNHYDCFNIINMNEELMRKNTNDKDNHIYQLPIYHEHKYCSKRSTFEEDESEKKDSPRSY